MQKRSRRMGSIKNLILSLLFLLVRSSSQQQCDTESCEETKKCVNFDFASFNENSPSIIYGEAKGRFGNQFLAYMVFHQLKQQLGVDSYIDSVCRYVFYLLTKVISRKKLSNHNVLILGPK